MKSFRKLNGEYKWFTDLGVKISTNDLLNKIRQAIKDLQKLNKTNNPKDKL